MGVRQAAAVASLVASAGALGLAAPALAMRWLARGRTYAPETVPHRPVALVLGAQVYPDGRPSAFLAARLDLARRLWAEGRVESFLLSGDGAAREYDEPAAMRRYLRQRGVPEEAIRTDPHGLDTYDSCWRAREIYGVRALTVVTQRYHLTRALALAAALGLDVVGVGDTTVAGRRSWRKGTLRELAANLKAVFDLVSGRRPTRR